MTAVFSQTLSGSSATHATALGSNTSAFAIKLGRHDALERFGALLTMVSADTQLSCCDATTWSSSHSGEKRTHGSAVPAGRALRRMPENFTDSVHQLHDSSYRQPAPISCPPAQGRAQRRPPQQDCRFAVAQQIIDVHT